MNEPLHFEDLKVGDCWKSRGRTVTESDVISFACLTGDFDPLHVDHEFASGSLFRKPIAHGLLGLSLVAGLGSNFPAINTLAFVSVQNWEFRRPIFFGDTVHVVNQVMELQPNGRKRGRVIWLRQLFNQAGEIVQTGTFETIVAARGTKAVAKTESPSSKPAPTAKPTPVAKRKPKSRTATSDQKKE